MWMMSIGQALAQAWQTMQRSSEKPNMPRKRSVRLGLSSGYWIVALRLEAGNRPVTREALEQVDRDQPMRQKSQKLIASSLQQQHAERRPAITLASAHREQHTSSRAAMSWSKR